jgi:hypothetical protein
LPTCSGAGLLRWPINPEIPPNGIHQRTGQQHTTMPQLDYRIASDSDLDLLCQYRRECGWGEDALKKNWTDPDRIFCVFVAEVEGEKRDVGMGCWYLHQPDDLELASHETKTVHLGTCPHSVSTGMGQRLTDSIASLFIRHQYQGLQFGTQALRILEQVAVERYGAVSVTLDTTAYLVTRSPCGTHHVEDFSKPNRTVAWYAAKGYSQFRVSPMMSDLCFAYEPSQIDHCSPILRLMIRIAS